MKKRIYVYATEDKEILGAFLTFNSLKEVVIDNLADYNLNLSSNTIEEMKNCKDIKDFEKMLSYLSIVDFVGAIEVDFDIKEGAKLYVWGTQNREIKGAYSTLKTLKKDIKAWYTKEYKDDKESLSYILEDLAGAHDTNDINIACSDENFVEETEIEE